jgi:hypothetical protein
MHGGILPLPQYVFMAWYFVENRDNFILLYFTLLDDIKYTSILRLHNLSLNVTSLITSHILLTQAFPVLKKLFLINVSHLSNTAGKFVLASI